MKSQDDSHLHIYVYDRHNKELTQEIVLGDSMLKLAYQSPFRGFLHFLLFKSGFLSRLMGRYCDSKISKGKIAKTIKDLKVNTEDIADPIDSFETFNQFFYRKLKPGARPFDSDPNILVSPADARLTVYPRLDMSICVPIKGAKFTVPELLGLSHEETSQYDGGVLMIFRLCPVDYHRYHFPASGKIISHRKIDGLYHSVNPLPIKLGYKIFQHNVREVTMLELEQFGEAAYVEVGAFGVAGIETTHTGKSFKKMDEKGYFKFGGSTVVMVFPPNKICVDHDLEERSSRGVETLIRAGDSIAELIQEIKE